MISALCRNSSSETVQQKESYEFQPLGGVLARSSSFRFEASVNTLRASRRRRKKEEEEEEERESFIAGSDGTVGLELERRKEGEREEKVVTFFRVSNYAYGTRSSTWMIYTWVKSQG